MSVHQGQFHIYQPRTEQTNGLVAFEHAPSHPEPTNIILFATGLTEGLLTVSYPRDLASRLPQGWSIAEVLLSSAYKGWGTASLQSDASELAAAVDYFRSKQRKQKVVLMGHSTGCQDCMEYTTGLGHETRPPVEGIMLQAPVSDPEAASEMVDKTKLNESIQMAQDWVNQGKAQDVLPSKVTGEFFPGPVTAYRWLSLMSPDHNGDDDYFSSYLTDEQLSNTFGLLPKSKTALAILFSGSDESVPKRIGKQALVDRWIRFAGSSVDTEASGVIPGANHNYEGKDQSIRDNLFNRVVGFVSRV